MVTAAVAAVACLPRDGVSAVCPDVEEGDLVVSELRGPQEGADSFGQWIEVYNAGEQPVDLYGLRVTFVPSDGSDLIALLIRREGAEVGPGEFAVLGAQDDERRPEHVDYGFGDELTNLAPAARVQLAACGTEVDSLLYRSLPTAGSLAVDGAALPDAAANDDDDALCTDDEPLPPDGMMTDFGVPGTPGEPNRPCAGPDGGTGGGTAGGSAGGTGEDTDGGMGEDTDGGMGTGS